MKITFEQEDSVLFAIAQNVHYKGKMCDEILYAEIEEVSVNIPLGHLSVFSLRWEDCWDKDQSFTTQEEAKQYVIANYTSHKPHINGKSYDIDEE